MVSILRRRYDKHNYGGNSMTGADLIARILKQEGVDFMGVIPFNTLEEAGAKAGIRPLIFRQERVGVNLADETYLFLPIENPAK